MDDKEQAAIDELRAAGLEDEACAVESLRTGHKATMGAFHAAQLASYKEGQAAERERCVQICRDHAANEIERLRAALTKYANPLNWSEDSAGIRRVWLEPDSTTPAAYNGFEAARADLKA